MQPLGRYARMMKSWLSCQISSARAAHRGSWPGGVSDVLLNEISAYENSLGRNSGSQSSAEHSSLEPAFQPKQPIEIGAGHRQ